MTAAGATPPDATPAGPAPAVRPPDPERGLRGIMSATLLLQAITVLLSIPVAVNTGREVGGVGVTLIVLLAVAMIGTCALITRPWVITAIAVLQVLNIAGWVLSAWLGIIGIVFLLVWVAILWMRTEFRRRQAAGTLPSQQRPTPPADPPAGT
ncbi:DUF4233 domain-containing protein [Nakamurella leprariae]|uniref:DUF4233 domain-containing protein n=1 Tax=Nakamurella leprariae TaxID=2803911 RepID=A0A938YEF7_9ACTN|nr:DUF4233 domain-containing protein [Nakamurella leprariae]MBM9468073.1 DUF4233 domain-containing protein [Nakamurella leprariae]